MITQRKKFNVSVENLRKKRKNHEKYCFFTKSARFDGYMHATRGGTLPTDAELSHLYDTLMEIDAFKSGYFSNYQGPVAQAIRQDLSNAMGVDQPHKNKITISSHVQHVQHVQHVPIEPFEGVCNIFSTYQENIQKIPSPYGVLYSFKREAIPEQKCHPMESKVMTEISFDTKDSDLNVLDEKAFESFDDIFDECEDESISCPKKRF